MTTTNHRIGQVNYELTNHLGNVLSSISDKPIPVDNSGSVDYWLADIRQSTDYSPFGVTLSGRNFTLTGAEKSRFGFSGKESDSEMKGEWNSYDFGARMYDPRIGRWLSRDPHQDKYPAQSSYTYSLNSPLLFKDPDGKDAIVTVETVGTVTTVTFTAKVYLIGSGITTEYIDLVNAMNDYHFSDIAGMYSENGQTYIMKVDVEYINATASNPQYASLPESIKQYSENSQNDEVPLPVPLEAKDEAAGIPHGSNVVYYDARIVNSSTRRSDSQAWLGIYPDKKEISGSINAAYATIHEVFHLLGLSDRYNQEVNKPTESHPGYENDWMSGGSVDKMLSWTEVEFSEAHVKNMVKGALAIYSDSNLQMQSSEVGGAAIYSLYKSLRMGALDKNDPQRQTATIYGEEQ